MSTTPAAATTSSTTTAAAIPTTPATSGVPLNATKSVTSKSINESLWWDSFVVLLEELDTASHSPDFAANLINKIKRNHAWFLNSVSQFKSPNEASRLALDADEISVGVHRLVVKPEVKEAALRASKFLCLDEVQTYILVSRSSEHDKSIAPVERQDFVQWALLQYFIERQCLLKCIRHIFVNSFSVSSTSLSSEMKGEALLLVDDGLEIKMISVLQDLLSSSPSEKIDFLVIHDVELVALWVDETIIEDILILDILFVAYYDNFCVCNSVQWRSLCSLFKDILGGAYSLEALAVSVETRASFLQAKAQLLLILIETLDLENLLRMVHDEVPMRKGGSLFSMQDVQEMDALVSTFSVLGTLESGPLFLAWAVFICLLSSLPDIKNHNILLEIDHVDYARQAFEAGAFNYLLEFLRSSSLRDSDGPISGLLSVLRTFMSAFIASYEITHQPENTLSLILEILCEIYNGEESLSNQFWDRDSFVDGPIRSLLYMLESEYPYQVNELIRLLLALCNGSWSAQCVYHFLDKMRGMTLSYEIPSGSPPLDVYDIVEAHQRIPIPSVDGIYISPGTCGQILKVIGVNVALVRWEWPHSGVYLLVLRLAQLFCSSGHDEVFLALNLFYRLISSNTALCYNFLHLDESFTQSARTNELIEQNLCIDVVRVISILAIRIIGGNGQTSTAGVCLSILAEMLKCNPSRVIDVVLSSNIFGTGVVPSSNPSRVIDVVLSSNIFGTGVVPSSGAWLLSDGISRMLLTDHEEESGCFLLTTSVLDFTIQLIQKGMADTLVSSLVVFSLQYVFVNHMHMKYKLKYGHWKVTLKVLAVMKSCLKAVRNSHKLSSMIRDILYFDSSIHSGLCCFLYASKQAFENSSASLEFGLKETEDLQDAVCSALEIVFSMLADLSKGSASAAPSFVQTMLPASSKTASVFTVTLSLMNLFSYPAVQLVAAKVLSMLCSIASRLQPYSLESITLVDSVQISDLEALVCRILDEELHRRNDFFIAIHNLLISAAYFQPSLLLPMISTNIGDCGITAGVAENNLALAPVGSRKSVIDTVLKCMDRSELLITSDPRLLMSILNFLKSLWDGGVQYMDILVKIRNSAMFWEHFSSILASRLNFDQPLKDMSDDVMQSLTYWYRCQAIVLEIMSLELFFQEKVSQNEIIEKLASPTGSNGHYENKLSSEASQSSTKLLQSNILSKWCQGSIIDDLMKSYSSGGYDIQLISRAKMAACVLIVHLMLKLSYNGTECLSMPIIEMIHMIQDKLKQNPSFSSLIVQYSFQGYSDGKEAINLVLHDLYYHLQGELEGRLIVPGPFQALSDFLLNFEAFQCKESTHEKDLWNTDVIMYEISSIRNELGIDLWDLASWKESKEIAEKCLSHMHAANLMITLADAKNVAQKALIDIISLRGRKFLKSKSTLIGQGISESFLEQSITYFCKCIQTTEDSLVPALNPPEKLLEMLTTQAEMLFVLSGILFMQKSHRNKRNELFPVSIILIRTSGSGFKLLATGMLSTVLNKAIKFLLMVLLMSMEFNNPTAYITDDSGLDDNQLSEVSLALVGLLPVLCKYVENSECFDLSVASLDLMLKGFLAPSTWLPILQEHLHLKNLVQITQKSNCLTSVTIALNFLLTLAQTKGGAEMLNSINIFPSLKIFFSHLVDDKFKPVGYCLPAIHDNNDKHAHLMALGFAIISSVIHSLHDDTPVVHIFDSVINNFFGEKAYMISLCLSILNVQSDDQMKKVSQKQKTGISLKDLCLSEHSVSLICSLARHREYRRKGMKEIDLEMRQKCIHLLAFISKEAQRVGNLSKNELPVLCLPNPKEEADFNEKPSFISSKHGWFMVSALGGTNKKVTSSLSQGLPLVTKDQPNGYNQARRTYFSDIVAVEIYRIAFLLLTFLCIQAKSAVKRAEEVGYIDLACFPDLPMPEILHGLQDQAMAIIVDICGGKSSSLPVETERVCLLMLQILEKSLYLEFCVTQSCGLRPVLGRVEDVAKEIKSLVQVVKQHKNLSASLTSIRQIVTLVYPGLLQTGSLV